MGTDTFTYRVWDGVAWSAPATVTITVTRPTSDPDADPDPGADGGADAAPTAGADRLADRPPDDPTEPERRRDVHRGPVHRSRPVRAAALDGPSLQRGRPLARDARPVGPAVPDPGVDRAAGAPAVGAVGGSPAPSVAARR